MPRSSASRQTRSPPPPHSTTGQIGLPPLVRPSRYLPPPCRVMAMVGRCLLLLLLLLLRGEKTTTTKKKKKPSSLGKKIGGKAQVGREGQGWWRRRRRRVFRRRRRGEGKKWGTERCGGASASPRKERERHASFSLRARNAKWRRGKGARGGDKLLFCSDCVRD